MRIAIVDDSQLDVKRLNDYLKRFAEENSLSVQPIAYSNAEQFLADYQFNFDLVIFDIDMPHINGVEAARLLRKKDTNVVLMFVTNMPQYALCGYEVEAVDYVIKPIAYSEFSLKLHKALRYIQRNQDDRITLRTADAFVTLSIREILYVESYLHYLTYHTLRQTYRVRQTLSEAEKSLEKGQFARCNASYLVNLHYVESIEKENVVVAGVSLKISRGKRAEFLNHFNRFLGGI